MSWVHRKIIRDASDVNVSITGCLETTEPEVSEVIVHIGDLKESPRGLKLTGFFHSLEDKITLLLYWEHESGNHALIVPILGRGMADFSRWGGGLEIPRDERMAIQEGYTGNILMRAYSGSTIVDRDLHFLLILELSKQRN